MPMSPSGGLPPRPAPKTEEVAKVSKTWEDEWKTESGLPDDFEFWVERSRFGFAPEYVDANGQPQPVLMWEGSSPDVDLERPILFSLGKGWKPVDEGRRVVHDSRKRFVNSSMYGRLIDKCMDELGMKDFLVTRGSPKDATIWEGLGFRMKRDEYEYPGLAKSKVQKLMPSEFLGERGKGRAKAAARPKAPPEEEPAEEAAAEERPYEPGVPEALVKQLTILAKNKSYEDFLNLVVTRDDVTKYPRFFDHLCDAGEDGFWAKARA